MEKPNDTESEKADAGTAAPNDDQSLEHLINQAERAHQLVDAVDLKKVAAHDDAELAKLNSVSDALTDLEAGRVVEHVEGVDEVVVIDATVNDERANLIRQLDQFGLGRRVDRITSCLDGEPEVKPLEIIPHREGLPEFIVCVAPKLDQGTGHFGMLVAASGVYAVHIGEPTNKHLWRVLQSRPYDNEDELRQCLELFEQTAFESA